MNAILVLLALLSLATLVARQRTAVVAAHIATTPAVLGMGFALGPRGLGFITSSTTDAFSPALGVGLTWLAFLAGLRVARPKFNKPYLTDMAATIGHSAIAMLMCGAAALGAMYVLADAGIALPGVSLTEHTVYAAALLLGGPVVASGFVAALEAMAISPDQKAYHRFLFLARHDDGLIAIVVVIAGLLWAPASWEGTPLAFQASAPFLVGLALAAVFILLAGSKTEGSGPDTITLIGLTTLAAGLGSIAHLPVVVVGYVFGAGVSALRRGPAVLGHGLSSSARPVNLVVLTLVGAELGFSVPAVLLGLLLAVVRVLAKSLLRRYLEPANCAAIPLGAVLGPSSVALPLTVSFVLSRGLDLHTSSLVTTMAVAISASELIAFVLWPRGEGVPTLPSEPAAEAAFETELRAEESP